MPPLIRLIYLALFWKICLFLLPREAILCLVVSSMIRLMELQRGLLWAQFLQTFLCAILKKSGYCADPRGIVLAKQKTITRTNHSMRFGLWGHHNIKHGRGRGNYPLIPAAVVVLSNFSSHFRRHEYQPVLFCLDWRRAIELKNRRNSQRNCLRRESTRITIPSFFLAIFFPTRKKFPLFSTTTTIFPLFALTKGWFPVSRNFYMRTCVKFSFANKLEEMHERSLVSVKVGTRSTFYFASILFTWLKFTSVNVRSQKRVSGNQH